ncbi:MAG: hypothetical protein GC152_09785 [Alphaproteobacteria bacterium]|nr:hypothetical protein [Alphaproteobacteria bacterium]
MRPAGSRFFSAPFAAISLAMALALSACDRGETYPPALATGPTGALSFLVIGDTPYDEADREMLAAALPKVRSADFPFIAHIGDYKGGGAPCEPEHDLRFKSLLAELAPTPVFYVPGDNEWTDCDRHDDPATGQKYSDLARLKTVRGFFPTIGVAIAGDAPTSMAAERQATQIENATWVHANVRFATVHAVGTNNGRDWVTGDPLDVAAAAANARDALNLLWISDVFDRARAENATAVVLFMHGDPTAISGKPRGEICRDAATSDDHACDGFAGLRATVRAAAEEFSKPVLVVHGDTAPFEISRNFAGDEGAWLWRLNAAGDAGFGRTGLPYGIRDVTIVKVDPANAAAPFAATGLVTGKPAKAL